MKKTAVITGSVKGLGRYIAFSLAKDGYTVALHYNKSRKEAEKLLFDIKKISPDSILVQADLRIDKEVKNEFKKIFLELKSVDLLINNVGNFIYKKFEDTSNEEFADILETNVLCTLYCSRAVLPQMRKEKKGHIINIGTVGADTLTLRQKSAGYFIAKNGLYHLTKMMAWEEARNGIHINMISPASLAEDIFEADQFPMGRSANYEDVYKVLRFLTSEDAYYINGANIEVAGAFIPGLSKGK